MQECGLKKDKKDFPLLIGQTGPLNGQRWIIDDEVIIGRDSDCNIIISDRQVSRFHAKLTSHQIDSVEVTDLGSKNGTFLNGKKVTSSAPIKEGDQIKIALIQDFLFISSDATIPLSEGEPSQPGKPGKLLIDKRARRVWVNEHEIIPPLSVQQFHLLQCLYDHQEDVVSREKIVMAVWGLKEGEGVTEQALDALIRRLRERIAELDKKHAYITTIRGFGFRLDNPDYQ